LTPPQRLSRCANGRVFHIWERRSGGQFSFDDTREQTASGRARSCTYGIHECGVAARGVLLPCNSFPPDLALACAADQ